MKQASVAVKRGIPAIWKHLMKYCLLCLLFCNLAWAGEAVDKRYFVVFSAKFLPEQGFIEASISVNQSTHLLRALDLDAPEAEFSGFTADGDIERNGGRLLWEVPETGGTLSYKVRVDHQRGQRLDARMTKDWAIMRLDDIFPRARVRIRIGASSHALLDLRGPEGWRFESRYRAVQGSIKVDDPERSFDRPTGWLAAGKLGVRREFIAHRRVIVAAPQGQGMRRMDILAFLRWTLPKLVKAFPDFPDRLLIVGARDGMWRGGLSGPGSFYLHSERPLISENATSAVLHELVHVATSKVGIPREDWIVEGLAEYYSLQILRRSRGISERRLQKSLTQLSDWVRRDEGHLASPSTGANTARAALLFVDIERELASHGEGGLDSVVSKLMKADAIDGPHLQKLVESALGGPSDALRQALKQDIQADTR